MNRSRLLGTVLFVVLLACVAVIVLDQMGLFSGAQSAGTPSPTPSAPAGTPTNGNGYGDLK
ncbi:hypothetical protein HNQ07_001798 [Deinococcus metalli]|uniref:Uncharacterized protein n=1 Tax=Deinococcus metalli TaxID=1141878 RepID=A0A7W8NP20_9DEIO|nr:hypothetical protein [Deinococcus metalli]MBB5376341.1 hypothetical protein [Deinococcus metalli]GHF39011.1 hypothetical protein GCM10017781_14410 [Deinococcus metalli]